MCGGFIGSLVKAGIGFATGGPLGAAMGFAGGEAGRREEKKAKSKEKRARAALREQEILRQEGIQKKEEQRKATKTVFGGALGE